MREAFLREMRTSELRRHRRGATIAARWLQDNDEHELALPLAIDAGDLELATRITRDLIITIPETYTTDRLGCHLERVPPAMLATYPVLAFALGLARLTSPLARSTATGLFEISAAASTSSSPGLATADRFFLVTMVVVSLRLIGRFSDSGRAASRALGLLASMTVIERVQIADYLDLALRNLAYSLLQAGQFDEAETAVATALTTATERSASPGSKNYSLAYAVGVHALNGSHGRARAALERIDAAVWPRDHATTYWPRDHATTYMNAMGVFGDALLALDVFDHGGAEVMLQSMDAHMQTIEFWPLITAATMHARMGLGEAESEAYRVEELLGAAVPAPGTGDNTATGELQNMLAILWLTSGHEAKARALAASTSAHSRQMASSRVLIPMLSGDFETALREHARLMQLPGLTIRHRAGLMTIGAAAALRGEDVQMAMRLAGRAAVLFATHGVHSHLLFLPDVDRKALLATAISAGLRNVVEYLTVDLVSPLLASIAGVVLTARERVVLGMLVTHGAHHEMAQHLFVSPNTIKSQLRSIYRKLGVTSRDAALRRAVELDLL